MPNEPFIYETTLDMCSVDFTGAWQPGAIFRAMQEAANGHCRLLHLTFEEMRKLGVAWVMTRAHLQMERYPAYGETVTVKTWPAKTRHMFFPRNFVFEVNGQEVGRAMELFVLMDMETRKIALPSRLPNGLPLYDIPDALPLPGNLKALDTPATERTYSPVYMDLDMNGHVNNTRYVDWFMNGFSIEKHRSAQLCDLLIHYNFEVTPKESVTLSLRESGDVSVLSGQSGDTVCFGVQGAWRAR